MNQATSGRDHHQPVRSNHNAMKKVCFHRRFRARGGTRTRTYVAIPKILSLVRLPFRHPGYSIAKLLNFSQYHHLISPLSKGFFLHFEGSVFSRIFLSTNFATFFNIQFVSWINRFIL